jgi:effector-binding domain-containing protein
VIESIGVHRIDEQAAAVVRGRARPEEIGAFVADAYGAVIEALGAQGHGPAGPPIVRYTLGADGMSASGEADEFGLEAGFPCPPAFQTAGPVLAVGLPGGDAVVAVHVGQWPELGEAYAAVEAHLAEHGLVHAGDPWETYLDGPEAAEHRTVLTAPCRPA